MKNSVFVVGGSPGLPEIIPPKPNPLDSSLLSQEPPIFYFGEDDFAFLHDVEKYTAGYTERQKIIYLLNSLFQNSFDTILPFLGFEYSYWYLQSVIIHELFYPQDQPELGSGEDYENTAPCHTSLSLPEDYSGSVQSDGEITLLPEGQETRISTDGLEKQHTKLVNPMKVIGLSKWLPGQYCLERIWDPDKLSVVISDAVQACDPKKMVESDAKAN
ncbi:hypothetical protein DSO57_1038644 [Entomophthora muscae]|uniref:Uncharacterized protein n=1 Tax=Entomophthora muscae TaxID=34485 RepID=A0ACC2T9E0_9FUNG|nr:hypothetical protein DSO57_1038644 [Entomophthora muscae]